MTDIGIIWKHVYAKHIVPTQFEKNALSWDRMCQKTIWSHGLLTDKAKEWLLFSTI